MKRYEVRARRDGRWWYVEIPELNGATQARHLGEVEVMAREYIALTLDQPESSIELDVMVELPKAAQVELDRLAAARTAESAARQAANQAARTAAQLLKNQGYTVREIGTAMHISHQRAQQLLRA